MSHRVVVFLWGSFATQSSEAVRSAFFFVRASSSSFSLGFTSHLIIFAKLFQMAFFGLVNLVGAIFYLVFTKGNIRGTLYLAVPQFGMTGGLPLFLPQQSPSFASRKLVL